MDIAHFLGSLGHWLFDVLIMTVGIKIIFAHWLAERLSAWGKSAFQQTETRRDILSHFEAHPGLSVAECELDACAKYC